jgi:hypothetical protein
MMSGYTEDHLIEQPAMQLMEHELGWDSVNAWDEWSTGVSNLGRETRREVVLVSRLTPVLRTLNAELPAEALDAAVEELTRDRSALSLVEANREIDKLLRGGVKVTIPDRERGGQRAAEGWGWRCGWSVAGLCRGLAPGFRDHAGLAQSLRSGGFTGFHRTVKDGD